MRKFAVINEHGILEPQTYNEMPLVDVPDVPERPLQPVAPELPEMVKMPTLAANAKKAGRVKYDQQLKDHQKSIQLLGEYKEAMTSYSQDMVEYQADLAIYLKAVAMQSAIIADNQQRETGNRYVLKRFTDLVGLSKSVEIKGDVPERLNLYEIIDGALVMNHQKKDAEDKERRAAQRRQQHRHGDYIDAMMKQVAADKAAGKKLIPEMSDALDHWELVNVRFEVG